MSEGAAYGSRTGRAVLVAAALGSGMAMLDSTVVNVALRRIGTGLDASLAELQWVANGYLLALASLILVGGSLGDRIGRRRVFVIGIIWFTVGSLACGLAQSPGQLIGARIGQGVGAALLTPGSLAMIQGTLRPEDRSRAIGAWAGFSGIATAIGPFLGGWLIDIASWRWIFFVNVPVAAVTVAVAQRWVPETRDEQGGARFDLPGAATVTAGLAGVTFALIEAGSLAPIAVGIAAAIGVLGLAAFITVELLRPEPMVPMELFRSRQFSGSNAMTLLVYAALGAMVFFLVLELQTVVGYSPLRAGIATLPITIIMLLLASKGGALAGRIGPRLPMAVGPLVCALGVALLSLVGPDSAYWRDVFPGVTIFALGLVLLVAPLTATVLAAAPDRHAGVASGINNAVARAGSLLAVAALPVAVGLSGDDYVVPGAFETGYQRAMRICAALLVVGGGTSYALVRNTEVRNTEVRDPAQ